MLNQDIQSKLAVEVLAALTTFVAAAGATNASSAVDIDGFNGVSVILSGDRALLPADVFTYTFTESDTFGGTYTEVPANAVLPFRKNPERTMVEEVSPYTQTVGVFSTKQFVKVSVTGTADTTNFIVTPTFIKNSNLMEFTGYDPAIVPGDGLP